MRRRESPLSGALAHNHSHNTSGAEGDASTAVSPLKGLLRRPKRQTFVHRRRESPPTVSRRKKGEALPSQLAARDPLPHPTTEVAKSAAAPQTITTSSSSALRGDNAGDSDANGGDEQQDEETSRMLPADLQSLEPVQLERKLTELRSAILAEKRERHKLKQKCLAQQKDLLAAQRDLQGVQAKLQSAHTLLASCEGFNKAALAESIATVDGEAEVVMVQLREAERELSLLQVTEGAKHRASLQNTVTSIRANDERKKVTAAKKKVAELEVQAAALRSEVEDLKRTRERTTAAANGASSAGAAAAVGSRGHRHRSRSSGSSNTEAAPVSAAFGGDTEGETRNHAGGGTDDVLKTRQKHYALELSKLQDDVTREAKQVQQDRSKLLEDVVRANHALTTEAAHLEQQRQMKEREVAVLHQDVERLSKAVERCRKAREEVESGKQTLVQQQSAMQEEIVQLQHRIQEATARLNQLILMSSDAPVMHEKAWAQERAGLQATLNTVLAKNKKMEGEKQLLVSKVEAIRLDLAAIDKLKREEATALANVKTLQGTLTAVQLQLSSLSLDDDGSQKRNIVADLEGAIRLEKRRVEELLGLNQRLEQRLSSLRSLLQQHGFDIC